MAQSHRLRSSEQRFQSDPLRNVYRGASVLLDGVTGFVGKAIFEKLLRVYGNELSKVYLLIRKGTNPKKLSDPLERLHREVLTNKIFVILRKRFSSTDDFDAFIREKVVPITGDLTVPGLGLLDADRCKLIENCNIIIHCAASVNFDERIDWSLEMNTLGTLRMMDLAEECRNLVGFIHVSSAYVNSNITGRVREVVYPMNLGSPRELVDRILGLRTDEDVASMTAYILTTYPNTYAFTKSLTEWLILERCEEARGGQRKLLPLSIVRASIVGASMQEPVKGWIDGMAAAGAGLVYMGLGLVHFFPGNTTNIADIVPVDHVVNIIVAAAASISIPVDSYFRLPLWDAHGASETKVYPIIYHAATSSRQDPTTWHHFGLVGAHYWSRCKPAPKYRLSKPSMTFIPSETQFKARFFLTYTLPYALYEAAHFATRAVGGASARMRRNVRSLQKMVTSAKTVTRAFGHFTGNSWIFEDRNVRALHDRICPYVTDCDLSYPDSLSWDKYLLDFNYGLHYFVLAQPGIRTLAPPLGWHCVIHEDVVESAYESADWDRREVLERDLEPLCTHVVDLVRRTDVDHASFVQRRSTYHPKWFSDFKFALKRYDLPDAIKPAQLEWWPSFLRAGRHEAVKQCVLGSCTVRQAVEKLSNMTSSSREETMLEAERAFNQLHQRLEIPYIRFLGWLLRKLFRQLFESVRVCEADMLRLKRFSAGRRMLLLPTHRSYMDFLVVSFVMFKYGMPVPAIAATEDLLQLGPISHILRHCGAFFIKRRQELVTTSPLYAAILKGYIETLFAQPGSVIEVFLEGTRTRTGMMLPAKLGIFTALLNPVLDRLSGKSSPVLANDDKDQDLLLVPIGLSYERILEEALITREVLGTPKPKESLANLARARRAIFGLVSGSAASSSTDPSHPSVKRKSPIHPVASSGNPGYGRVHFSISRAISVRDHVKLLEQKMGDGSLSDRKLLIRALARYVQELQLRVAAISPVSLLASVILGSRPSGGISVFQAKTELVWLKEECRRRGYTVDWEDEEDVDAVLFYAVRMLNYPESVELDMPDVTQVDSAILRVPGAASASALLKLAHSRNLMLHCLFQEALVCVVLVSFGLRKAVALADLKRCFASLRRRLEGEFLVAGNAERGFSMALANLQSSGLISVDTTLGVVRVQESSGSRVPAPLARQRLRFLASLVYDCSSDLPLVMLSQLPREIRASHELDDLKPTQASRRQSLTLPLQSNL